MIAVVDAYRAGLFARGQWANNLVAGLVVGVVALPLAMAFDRSYSKSASETGCKLPGQRVPSLSFWPAFHQNTALPAYKSLR